MKLTHKESIVIRLRYGIGVDDCYTPQEIAEIIGFSKYTLSAKSTLNFEFESALIKI